MPLTDTLPPFKTSRRQLRGIMTPLDQDGNDNPALDPSYGDNDPPPIVEPHELSAPTASSISDPAPRNGNYNGLKRAMPPPGSPAVIPPPSVPSPQATAPPQPPATPPVQQLPPPPAGTAKTPLGTLDTQPVGVHPDKPVPPLPDDSDQTPSQKAAAALEQAHAERPEPPKSNFAQRMGLMILSLTRYAPIANQLMHPKYAEQSAAYQAQIKDLEARQKEAETQESTEASVAQKEGSATYKNAQAEQQKLLQQENTDRVNQRADAAFLKSLGPNAQQLGPTDQIPPGYTLRTNPRNPQERYAVGSAMVAVPPELASKFPGHPVGSMVPHADMQKAVEALYKEQLANVTAGNKVAAPDKLDIYRLAAMKVGVDPNDTSKWTPQQASDVAAEVSRQKLSERPVNNFSMTVPGLQPGGPGTSGTETGEDYLSKLPTGTAAEVRGIMEGRAALPPFGSRGASDALRQAVFRADPQFSEQRAQIRKAFITGPDGRNIGALNTATVHLDQLSQAADAMSNGSFTPGNQVYNWLRTRFGDSAVTNFNALKAAVAGELANSLKGVATDVEIRTIGENINAAGSPEQLKGAVETNLHILGAKLNTYHERYLQQIPGDTVWSPVLPSARRIYQKHGFDPVQGGPPLPSSPTGGGGTTVSITDPAGKVHSGLTQAQADVLRKKWGVK